MINNCFDDYKSIEGEIIDQDALLKLKYSKILPQDAGFYRDCVSEVNDELNRGVARTTDQFIRNNNDNWIKLEEELLSRLGLTRDEFGIYVTSSGTEAGKSIYKVLNTNDMLFISGNRNHQNIESAGYLFNNRVNIPVEQLEMKDDEWVIEGTNWYNEIKNRLSVDNINRVIISIVGTDTVIGERLPNLFIKELRLKIDELVSQYNYADTYFILDGVWEAFNSDREYDSVDFTFMTSHALALPDGFGLVIYRRREEIVRVLKDAGYISDDYLDLGHPVYMLPVLKVAIKYTDKVKLNYPYFYNGLNSLMEEVGEWIKKDTGYSLERVITNKYLEHPGNIYSFEIVRPNGSKIDLLDYQPYRLVSGINKYDNGIMNGGGVLYRVCSKDLLNSREKFRLMVHFIKSVIMTDKLRSNHE